MLLSHTIQIFRILWFVNPNTVWMHALETLFYLFSAVPNRFKNRQTACFKDNVFKVFSEVPNRFKYRLNACFRYIVIFFSAVPNRFKNRQNACFKDNVFKVFSAVPNRFIYRLNACFSDIVIFFLQFQIVSNTVWMHTVKMHALKTMFLFFSKGLALTSFYSYNSMSRDGNTFVCLFYLKNVIQV